MKAVVTEIPDEVSDWPSWLEQQIVGMSLYDLVVGLKAINEASDANPTLYDHDSYSVAGSISTDEASPTLQQVCGEQLPTIYESGLGVLSTEQIGSLFTNPELLLELQELVLIEGGSYWDSVEQSSEDKLVVERHVAKTLTAIGQVRPTQGLMEGIDAAMSSSTKQQPSVQKKPKSILEQYWPVLVLAAGLLIAVGIWSPTATSDGGGWGFDKSGLLTAQVTGRSYLNSLSDAAGTFSKKVPDSKEATLKRLKEFSAGCSKLIAAPNLQLEDVEDRKALVAKCKDWSIKIDGHIADLKQDKKEWREVLKEANETARKMQEKLKDLALQLT